MCIGCTIKLTNYFIQPLKSSFTDFKDVCERENGLLQQTLLFYKNK